MQELSPETLETLADAIAKRLADRWGLSKLIEPSRPELVDVYSLADAVGLSVPTINRAIAAGTIPSVQAGRRRLFVVADVVDAIRAAGEHLTPKRPKSTNDQSPAGKTRGARS
jgi:excisionase family DNA binding protein